MEVNLNIWGFYILIFSINSMQNLCILDAKFPLNFIDDFSWFITMYLLKHKSYAFENFKHHKLQMEN
jgi:hypothetical protein